MPSKLCFVIGPIGAAGSEDRTHADWLLSGIIKPVFRDHFPEFDVLRADEIKAPGDINSQIINRIMDAELVIADMSLHNANAFYELAIRHMMRLPTIHIIHKDWKIPFDVAPYRAIHFSRQEYGDLQTAQAELASVVMEVIAPEFVVENPITHARARFELDQHATPAVKALADELAEMRTTLEAVQRQLTEQTLKSLSANQKHWASLERMFSDPPRDRKPGSFGADALAAIWSPDKSAITLAVEQLAKEHAERLDDKSNK